MSKQIIQFFLVVILIIQSNAKGAISDICLRSAEHISRAPIDAHKDEVIDPKLFKDYEKVNVDAIAYYSDYFESNNPSATQAYFYLLKGLRAVRFITSNGKVSTIHSFEETLSIIKDTRQYPNEESFSSITLGRTSSILLVKKNILLNLACKSVSMRSTGCSDALEFLIKSVDNFGTSLGDTLYRKIIEKYFTQNEHNLILRTAALRMLELLENYLITNELPKKDVYQEIKESLMSELKFTNKSASSWALSILVLFSTRGAEWMSDGIHRMGGARNSSLASIFLITSAIQFFDKITFKLTGKQFSIPSQIDTSCYYAKPYHFWMAAYMAHDAVINGKFNKRDAVVATHLLGVGYELGRIDEKYTRKTYDWLPLGIEKQFSPAANAARIDLVYNTMGAWFGAIHLDLDSNTKKLNATSALFRIFMKSNALRSIFLGIRSVRVIDFYYYYAPNAHVNYVLSKL